MDANIVGEILKQGGFYAILVGVLYWLFKYYIPSKDEEHKAQMVNVQQLFKDSLNTIVSSYSSSILAITTRLDRIEEDVRGNNKN